MLAAHLLNWSLEESWNSLTRPTIWNPLPGILDTRDLPSVGMKTVAVGRCLKSELDAIYTHMYHLDREDLEWILIRYHPVPPSYSQEGGREGIR